MGRPEPDRSSVMPSFTLAGVPATEEAIAFRVRHYATPVGGWYEYASAVDAAALRARCEALSAQRGAAAFGTSDGMDMAPAP